MLRCLEVKAGRRYPTAAQLAHDLRHPDQVALTARGEKLETDGFFAVLKRKGEPPMSLIDSPPPRDAEASDAPIVGVAVNLDDMTPELADKLRRTALRILERSPDARLAVLNVLKLNRIALDQTLDEQGHNKHVQRLVGLKDWARPMKLERGPHHLPCAGGDRSRGDDPRLCARQQRRSHHHGRARQFHHAQDPRQRVGQGRGGGALHRHRGEEPQPRGVISPAVAPGRAGNRMTKRVPFSLRIGIVVAELLREGADEPAAHACFGRPWA